MTLYQAIEALCKRWQEEIDANAERLTYGLDAGDAKSKPHEAADLQARNRLIREFITAVEKANDN